VPERQSVTERDGVDGEAVLVDQAVAGQRVREARAAEADHVVSGLLLERWHSVLDGVA
jgi:hypothetical protein